jgi:hypothetical protein
MHGDTLMKRFPQPDLCVALWVLLLWIIIVPCVSAANPASVTTTATVPPVLQACAHATNPVAGFTCSFPGDPSALIPEGPPYIIKCMDNSSTESNQSIVSWKWDFGDGGSSTDQNPYHTYSEASRYDIRQTVTTWCGSKYSNTTTDSIFIYCSVPEPGFTTNVTEGFAPLAVQVSDASKNTPKDITRWTYWFDNSHFSHERNPVFIYSTPGTFAINQTVRKDCVQISSKFYPPSTRQIIVHPPPALLSEVNGTNTTPATALTLSPETLVTSAVPVATTIPAIPAVTSGIPVTVVTTDTVQNVPAITGPSGIAILPVIALTLIILGVIGAGIYLYRTQKKE